MKWIKCYVTLLLIAVSGGIFEGKAQEKSLLDEGTLSGNIQMNAQYYMKDSVIGATDVPEKVLSNGAAEIQYRLRNFSAGLRYEFYLDPMIGTDAQYKGQGISNYYATFMSKQFEITMGSFYEQFGNGLILRTYRDTDLGLDNALNGGLIKFMPADGIVMKGLIGKQRYYWEYGDGIVRGFDTEVSLNDAISSLKTGKLRVNIGGSLVSKYQEETLYLVGADKINFPENVAAVAGRANLSYGKFGLQGEYAYKYNDPSAANQYIFRAGQALLLTGTYSQKGLGVMVTAKRVDNMSYKSDRTVTGNMLNINYLPATTRQHTYALPAIYPYETQPNGEMAIEGDITYTIPKGTALGGKYGTEFRLNYSRVQSIVRNWGTVDPLNPQGTAGYDSPFFEVGDELYYQDFNIEVSKKINKSWKAILMYMNLTYNKSVILAEPGEEDVHANIIVGDVTYNINKKQSLRMEAQHLWTKQDEGNWAYVGLEYSIAPKWFFSASDMYNYGVTDEHYYSVAAAYTLGGNRVQLGYGRTRAGVNCSGGVCRYMPATNGFNIAITSTF